MTIPRNMPGYEWLAEGSVVAQQRTMHNLDAAWQRVWKDRRRPAAEQQGVRPPTFKKRGDGFGFSGRAWVRTRNSRRIEGEVMNATVRRAGRKWDLSLGTEREVPTPASRRHIRTLGLDMGIAHLATGSDGRHIDGPRALKAAAQAKANAQRIAARRMKGSPQRRRQQWKVAKIDRRTGNIRRNHLHQTTTAIAKNHGMVAPRALRVRAMTASAAGTVESAGRNVRAKAGLNRAILDQGWNEMRRQLAYKLCSSGGVLVLVDPRNTSRHCSVCGHTSGDNRTSQASFACVGCGHAMHADVNAAVNILAAGIGATAAGPVAENAGEGDGKRPAYEPSSLALRARIPVL